jgi:hypothetical protein
MNSKSKITLILVTCYIIYALSGCILHHQAVDSCLQYNAVKREIKVDGDSGEWEGIKRNIVQGVSHLWINEELPREKWEGNRDLSFSWSGAWYGNKFYFLIEVNDNNLQPCIREFSWLNDCVEIQFDPRNLKGERITGVSVDTPIPDRIGKKINGYEMHFLPCDPPKVYLDDTQEVYRLENEQTQIFYEQWDGEIKRKLTEKGYVLEIGFSVPDLQLRPTMIVGLDVAVGDDDGNERKSLMLWTGKQVPFWITMDYFGKMILVD